MDSELAEALCLVSACNDLGHFASDNPEDLKTLVDGLNNVDMNLRRLPHCIRQQ